MSTELIVVGVLGAVAVYVIGAYNKFVSMKAQIEASIQEIGNQLKRQADLIPNLQESVKGYLRHEKGIFEALTDARKTVENAFKNGGEKAIEAAEDKISTILPKLQVLVESNPEVKGVEVVNKLMGELRDTSDKLMYARRTVIDLTQDFNQALAVFPSNLVGSVFGMKKEKGFATHMSGSHLELGKDEMETPKIDL